MNIILQSVAGFGISAVVTAIGLSALAAGVEDFHLNVAATDVKRIIETDGVYDAAEQQKVAAYLQNNEISATVSVTGDNIQNLSLGDAFTVTLQKSYSFGVAGIGFTPLTFHGRADGTSEVYHK